MPARKVLLQRDAIADFGAPPNRGDRPQLGDRADDLVTQNTGDTRRTTVILRIAAAHSAGLNAQQTGVRRNDRSFKLAYFRNFRRDFYRGAYPVSH